MFGVLAVMINGAMAVAVGKGRELAGKSRSRRRLATA
jgi:hypothetical protein